MSFILSAQKFNAVIILVLVFFSGRTEFQTAKTNKSRRSMQFERRPSQRFSRRASYAQKRGRCIWCIKETYFIWHAKVNSSSCGKPTEIKKKPTISIMKLQKKETVYEKSHPSIPPKICFTWVHTVIVIKFASFFLYVEFNCCCWLIKEYF